MISDTRKAPFPWFGGKRDAAGRVWEALGDPPHYVEPFFGTGAVLLNRPHEANRAYVSETVNDADGLLVNFWRAVQLDPQGVAEAASWPVSEADKTARSCAVLAAGRRLDLERLMGDPLWHDPQLAGWWVWCVCVQIGAFGAGGPWWPDEDGRIRRWAKGEPRPEPGVSRGVPHLGNDGRGVNHAGLREPGVFPITDHPEYHPMVMPGLRRWLGFLSARLRHVRIICGDWRRAVGTGAALTLPVRQGKGPCGVFLDPPYADGSDVYRDGSSSVALDAAAWAVDAGTDPRWRIVAAGYDDDDAHPIYEAAGWTAVEWFRPGHLKGGYGDGAHRDRLYLSPHCLRSDDPQRGLW